MNYYPHHIGDFDRSTRHLTRLERSIYRDLIDVYYDTEHELTTDVPSLCRKIIARTDEEATTVERILNEFFTLGEKGWFHERCDEEIRKYWEKQKQASAAGKASANKRLSLGKATAVEQTLNERATDVQLTNNQEPITSNQKKKEPKGSSAASYDAPDWVPEEQWRSFVQMRKAMRGVPFTQDAANGVIRELQKFGNLGHNIGELLETAVMNGWRTVYEPKGRFKVNGSSSLNKQEALEESNINAAIRFVERNHP